MARPTIEELKRLLDNFDETGEVTLTSCGGAPNYEKHLPHIVEAARNYVEARALLRRMIWKVISKD